MASVKTRKHPIYRRTLETEIIRMQTTTLNGAALKENSHLCRGSLVLIEESHAIQPAELLIQLNTMSDLTTALRASHSPDSDSVLIDSLFMFVNT